MNIELREAERIKVLNSDDIYSIMQSILLREDKIDQNREHFWVIGLENNNRILFIELISLGTVNKALVEPMEVFSFALQKRAVRIILCHNHPSGELSPSAEDLDVTDRLIQVGIIVDTNVADHLIITPTTYLSFENSGLMTELKLSTKYVPPYVLEQRIAKEAAEIAEERHAIKVALQLKKEGVDDAFISRVTGLTIDEIKAVEEEDDE